MSDILALPKTRVPILCLAGGLWAFSFGASAELASVWLKRAGYDYTTVGLNTSVYYLAIALAASLVPWMMRRWGRSALAAGMVASGISVMLFPWGGGIVGWFVLRALNGVSGAMSLIPIETLINRGSPADRRARNFGYYAVSVATGMALGAWLGMELDVMSPRLAFLVGGGVTLVLGTGVLFWLPEYAGLEEERHDRSPLEFARNFLAFGSAWLQGFLEGGMVSQLPIYLLALGFHEERVGTLLGGLMIGVILAQVPLAWLADRFGRRHIVAGCYGVVAAGLVWLWLCGGSASLPVALFTVGACSGALYPLGLSMLGERLPPASLARASAWYLAINCLGSVTGPLATGAVMDFLNQDALFLAGEAALLIAVVGCLGCRWVTRRRNSNMPAQRRAA